MSLTASMWTGVSGLLGHGEKMNVVGNNIANVSTVGFKAQRMDFEDFIYATTHSASGPAQIGRGVDIGIIMGDFSQGAFETTQSAVELAIGGAGFFKVQPVGTEQAYYTRAGNFHFNVDGYLVDPHGYAVQGWKINNDTGPTRAAGGAGPSVENQSPVKGSGVPRDVRLDTWTVPPKQTTKTSVIVNLSADGKDASRNIPNPFASLIQSWDGTQPPPNNKAAIAETSYAYTTSIKVYDESGLQHTLTVYYDKVDPKTYNGKDGETLWEYMVTMDPSEDKRQVWDAATGGLVDMKNTKGAGVLMSGVMTFDAGGSITNQTAYTLMGDIAYDKDASGSPIADGANYVWSDGTTGPQPNPLNPLSLVPVVPGTDTWESITESYYPAAVSQAGYPMLVANFGGVLSANTAGSPVGDKYLMEFNQGIQVTNYASPWTTNTSLADATRQVPVGGGALVQNPDYTADGKNGPKVVAMNPDYPAGPPPQNSWPYMATNMTVPYTGSVADKQSFIDCTPSTNDLGFISGQPYLEANSNKMLGTNYATMNGTAQNGYTFGNLTGYNVDADGVLYGVYSNGVTLGLYQLTLYDFTCKQGLYREGGNLYSQTMESGEAYFGPPQTNGLGKINSYSLEQSNVDLAKEFVQMITTQRGFQANSKVITTTDTMLETVVSMKR